MVGHRCEIWSLLVHRTKVGDGPQEELVLTGAADELIRGYRVVTSGDDLLQVLVPIGSVERLRPAGADKCSSLSANATGTLVAAQSSGKIVEVRTGLTDAWVVRSLIHSFYSVSIIDIPATK